MHPNFTFQKQEINFLCSKVNSWRAIVVYTCYSRFYKWIDCGSETACSWSFYAMEIKWFWTDFMDSIEQIMKNSKYVVRDLTNQSSLRNFQRRMSGLLRMSSMAQPNQFHEWNCVYDVSNFWLLIRFVFYDTYSYLIYIHCSRIKCILVRKTWEKLTCHSPLSASHLIDARFRRVSRNDLSVKTSPLHVKHSRNCALLRRLMDWWKHGAIAPRRCPFLIVNAYVCFDCFKINGHKPSAFECEIEAAEQLDDTCMLLDTQSFSRISLLPMEISHSKLLPRMMFYVITWQKVLIHYKIFLARSDEVK